MITSFNPLAPIQKKIIPGEKHLTTSKKQVATSYQAKPDTVSFGDNASQSLKERYQVTLKNISALLTIINTVDEDLPNIRNLGAYPTITMLDSTELAKAKVLRQSMVYFGDYIDQLKLVNRESRGAISMPLNTFVKPITKAMLDCTSSNITNKSLKKELEQAQIEASKNLVSLAEIIGEPLAKALYPTCLKQIASRDTPFECKENLRKIAWHGYQQQNLPDYSDLKRLANAFKGGMSAIQKDAIFGQILAQEEKILAKELFEPEKHFTDALLSTTAKEFPETQKEQVYFTTAKSLNGLCYHFLSAKNIGVSSNPNVYIEQVGKILGSVDPDSRYADKIELKALTFLNVVYKDLSSQNKAIAENLAFQAFFSSPFPESRRKAFQLFQYQLPKHSPPLLKLEKTLIDGFKKLPIDQKDVPLMYLGKLNSKELDLIVPALLKNDQLPFELKRAAAWSAGIAKNDQNFKLLVNFLAGISETPNINDSGRKQLYEMGLSSYAEYAKIPRYEKPAIRLIQGFIGDDPIVSNIANDLLEKLQKKDEEPYFYVKKVFSNAADAKQYLALRNSLIPSIQSLTPKEQNYIDKAILPVRKVLPELLKKNVDINISKNHSITYDDVNAVGERAEDGRFYDVVKGVCSGSNKIILDNIVEEHSLYNSFAHEFGHLLDNEIIQGNTKLSKTLEDLYEKVSSPDIVKTKCINSYAATDKSEYFADGYEAFTSITKPHYLMINNLNYENTHACTLTTLLNKDMNLFDYIYDLTVDYGDSEAKPPLTRFMKFLFN